MKTVEGVCKELKTLDGVVGAFVLRQSQCIGSSLPPQYDPGRLAQVADALARVSQISEKAGYAHCATAFHWQRASLLTWPLGDDATLSLLATPNAVREAVNMSASIAIEDLSNIFSNRSSDDSNDIAKNAAPAHNASAPPDPVQDSAELNERLREIERLLVEELGPGGRSLLERCRNKTLRGKLSASEWLLRLRSAVLADVAEPGARATISMSYFWTDLD